MLSSISYDSNRNPVRQEVCLQNKCRVQRGVNQPGDGSNEDKCNHLFIHSFKKDILSFQDMLNAMHMLETKYAGRQKPSCQSQGS